MGRSRYSLFVFLRIEESKLPFLYPPITVLTSRVVVSRCVIDAIRDNLASYRRFVEVGISLEDDLSNLLWSEDTSSVALGQICDCLPHDLLDGLLTRPPMPYQLWGSNVFLAHNPFGIHQRFATFSLENCKLDAVNIDTMAGSQEAAYARDGFWYFFCGKNKRSR